MANIQVTLEGKGPVTLRDSNYVASGGEGTIYRLSNLVVKIYHEPEKARQRGMPEKIRLLTKLRHPFVSSPIDLVLDKNGEPIGHYLEYVDGHPLSRVFTNEWWQREGFNFPKASALVDGMREVVSFAHQNGATLVDANELNWFAVMGGQKPEPRVIDVDSWAIGRWGATVIMPSIRDYHAKKFCDTTDWFAWGIVSFQAFTGIHPYKGTLDGFDRSDLVGRMKANASVFSKGVRLNRAVRDFSNIPGKLLSWYEAAFQQGERSLPPSPFDTSVQTPTPARIAYAVTTRGGKLLVLDKLLSILRDQVVRTWSCGVALLASGKVIDIATKRVIAEVPERNMEIVHVGNGWLIASLRSGKAVLSYVDDRDLKRQDLALQIQGSALLAAGNRLFVATEAGLTEVKLTFLGKVIASVGETWGAMANSTKWFPGLGVMDAMGAMYLIMPIGDTAVAQARVTELDGLRIVNGKAGGRFASIVGLDKKGDYRKIEVVFGKDDKPQSVWVGDTDGPELNLAILPKGVCATIVQDGELNIFVPSTKKLNRVNDDAVSTDMILSNWGDRVIYLQNGEVWSVRLK